MRSIVNLLIAGLILAGAFLLMMIGFVSFILRRLFGRPAVRPRFQRPVGPSAPRPTQATQGDVIDVVATEVKE